MTWPAQVAKANFRPKPKCLQVANVYAIIAVAGGLFLKQMTSNTDLDLSKS